MFRFRSAAILTMAAVIGVTVPASSAGAATQRDGLTPVVMFPAFHFTKLRITVHDQRFAPDCPGSGTFEDWFQNDHPSTTFSQVCQDKMMTLRVTGLRFLDQPGVRVEVKDYGTTQ